VLLPLALLQPVAEWVGVLLLNDMAEIENGFAFATYWIIDFFV
jgi:hypothetical protein